MSVEQALRTRRSVRAFLPVPVTREEVERLLALASMSASNSNSQPWRVHVLMGAAKHRLATALLEAFENGRRLPETALEYPYQPAPDAWPEPFRTRRHRFGEWLYGDLLGIGRADMVLRNAYHARNYTFFGAPVGLVVTVSRHLLAGALLDAGLFLQALMLAARGAGLDTCPQASLIHFHPVLRDQLSIPDDQTIVCGLALGYADPGHVLCARRTTREPVENFAVFHGGAGRSPAGPGRGTVTEGDQVAEP
ncbi:nitroreductase [Actinomadura mexicana]|uniref:nitroreductase n=1 Tax=Actinomadura mexicana TaxID=134959 RepID=UPI001C5283BF|nr:nitroreductase [Actinomadura mexicana]